MKYNPYKSIYVPDSKLWERVRLKADKPDIDRSISKIICKLLEKWLNGDVGLYESLEEEKNNVNNTDK